MLKEIAESIMNEVKIVKNGEASEEALQIAQQIAKTLDFSCSPTIIVEGGNGRDIKSYISIELDCEYIKLVELEKAVQIAKKAKNMDISIFPRGDTFTIDIIEYIA
jgi:hypothetical protein